MRLKFALFALATLGGAALPAGTASAMPIGLATNADIASIDEVQLVCNAYGRCWRVPEHAYGYYGGTRSLPLWWRILAARTRT